MMYLRRLCAVCICITSLISFAAQAITLHTSDFINDATRTNYNGFESIPNDGMFYTGGSGPYIEDGIKVEQINGDPPNDIWANCNCGTYEGSYSWYPIGGDYGYTMISMADGSDFNDIGFYASSGGFPTLILFDLLLDGSSVFTGSASITNDSFYYIGFSGGGFDTVLVRDNWGGGTFYSGTENGLTLDAIEISAVPIPAAVWLFGSGLLGLVSVVRGKNA